LNCSKQDWNTIFMTAYDKIKAYFDLGGML
jgi:hypothetical protein